MVLLQLRQLIVAEGQIVEFLKLVTEQLMTRALFVAGIGQALQLLTGLAPALGGQLHLARQLLAAGIFIQQAAVGVRFKQGLVFVLVVDVDQQFAKGLEVALGAGRAVDVAARTAFGGDHPAQDARAVVVQVALAQPLAGFGDGGQVEAGENVGLVGAGAHHAAVGTIAQGQAEGIEHDRFAGAGFAGYHRHAGVQLEVEVFDDGVVVNRKMYQHGGRSQAYVWLFIQCFVSG